MNKILDFFYPPRCQLCASSQNLCCSNQLCTACMSDIRLNKVACQICAVPIGFSSFESGLQSTICAQCTTSRPVFDSSWSPFIYAQPLEWMIQQLKFNAKLNIAPLLSSLMEVSMPQSLYKEMKPDVIIPMPLHNKRLKQRGFNQSYLLIKPIAKKINLPIDLSSCERVRDTEHQTGKNALQRKLNIKNAFKFINTNNYQHVVIFDDVVTTGSSVSELSKTLKNAGVKRVDIWSLARAEK